MLRLFQSIFATERARQGRYPKRLVDAAIERAVDGTDPRIRVVPGYARRLEPVVIHAIDHVVQLVEGLPPLLDVSGDYGRDPRRAFLLYSRGAVREVASGDREVAAYVESAAGRTTECFAALMLCELEERNVFGMEIDEGGSIRRDVAQVAVGLSGRRLVDPAPSDDLMRRQLERRAFDHILGIALHHIGAAAKERSGLATERTLLRRKLKVLESAGWTFQPGASAEAPSPAAIEAKLDEIERQLGELGGQTGILEVHLDRLADVLARAERQLWMERRRLIVDRMGIRRDHESDSASAVTVHELHNSLGRTAVAQPVSIPRGDVRARPDVIAQMRSYLG